ncbi:hypothetical protein JOY44_14500 [Phormidium sp. CLA17]|uniref:hypothetical protein n=1 Tax=Leptolyngbya sp. Cla-17 TaxID=2803751 RepID=UPI0014913ED4|nr:hypothetical protein [Leptolyngbya sp. Cla-17]MBM0742803.1 hypothetical protein [Leptolyngbya sp. Cla-17]
MSTDNLNFLDDGESIASTVSQLHHYFKTTHSRYKLKQGNLLNRVHVNAKETAQVQEDVQHLEEVIALFGILTDSLSVANRVLHSEAIAQIIGSDADVYKTHLEDEQEHASERAAAERKVAQRNKE